MQKFKVKPNLSRRFANEITILREVGFCNGAALPSTKDGKKKVRNYKQQRVFLAEVHIVRERIRKDEKGFPKTIQIDRTVKFKIREDHLRARYNAI